jgi:chemotaxis protein histidine kinase CheA
MTDDSARLADKLDRILEMMVQISDREAAARADARAEREERERAAREEREEREKAAREEREVRERAAREEREEREKAARVEREEREKAARAEREEREKAARVEREEREEREKAARAVREEAARADRARSDKLHETFLKVLLQRDATRDDKYLPEQIVAGHAKRNAACAGISPAEPPKHEASRARDREQPFCFSSTTTDRTSAPSNSMLEDRRSRKRVREDEDLAPPSFSDDGDTSYDEETTVEAPDDAGAGPARDPSPAAGFSLMPTVADLSTVAEWCKWPDRNRIVRVRAPYADIVSTGYAWEDVSHQGAVSRGKFHRKKKCLGVMMCKNRCGYVQRPYVPEKRAGVAPRKRRYRVKEYRETCHGLCAEQSRTPAVLEHVQCTCELEYRSSGDGVVVVKHEGTHDHPKPPVVRITATERRVYVEEAKSGEAQSAKKKVSPQPTVLRMRIWTLSKSDNGKFELRQHGTWRDLSRSTGMS